MKSSPPVEKAKAALWDKYVGPKDGKGYTPSLKDNLVPGVGLAQFQEDLLKGHGNELAAKFRAVHSSSALAVNCFARFKDAPHELLLMGQRGTVNVQFEKQLRIFSRGTPANLDVWLERAGEVIAVESKLLEYFKLTKPKFSNAYERLKPPFSEPCWWAVYNKARQGTAQHLDRAQLIRHYFGLRKYQQSGSVPLRLTLLYIFWEPLNWQEIDECKCHRREVEAFADAVSPSEVSFRLMTYNDLLEEWSADPVLAPHAQNLKARYEVCL